MSTAGGWRRAPKGAEEFSIYHSVAISPDRIVPATNLIAVEAQQANPDSSDLSFEFRILARVGHLPPVMNVIAPLPDQGLGAGRDLVLRAVFFRLCRP